MNSTNAPILIVDDDDDIRELIKVFLEAEGYRVNGATDGLDAWEQVQSGLQPSLILLDLMMPRMDGEQFLKKLRSCHLSEIPVIILSGNISAKEKSSGLKASCFLTKPVEIDELLNAVRRFVHSPIESGLRKRG